MAHRIEFLLEGNPVPKVETVDFDVAGYADKFTKMAAQPTRPGFLRIRRRSDHDLSFLQWAAVADKESRKSGVIRFFDDNDQKMTELKFENSYVTSYIEVASTLDVSDQSRTARGIYEEIKVSAERIVLNDVELAHNDWA